MKILKKNKTLVYFVDPRYKLFINSILESCYFLFHNTISPIDSFKYRYHEHKYSHCRLLHFDKFPPLKEYWTNFLKSHILDIIVVSCHYSTRFTDSDHYILQYCSDPSIQEYTLYLKNKDEDTIVNDFITSYISIGANSNLTITWDNMYFLWKEYLKGQHFPNIIFKENLKINLSKKLNFNIKNNCFYNISSKHLTYVQFFSSFWTQTIIDVSDNNFEIGELCLMYKNWLKKNYPKEKYLREDKLLAIIQYFYPKYMIKDNKYISNISSILWDKKKDIKSALLSIKKLNIIGAHSFYQIYEFYCKYAKQVSLDYIVSKQYFEKELRSFIPKKYIMGETIQDNYWKS